MSVDPALLALAQPIEAGQPWPRPHCPDCNTGHVRFGEPVEAESPASGRDHWAFEPEWIRGRFVVHGECENPGCREAVHAIGDYRVNDAKKSVPDSPWADQYADGPQYSIFYSVAHLHPPMLLMPIPESAPEEVREGVLRASRVLFADPGLAATALRATVERFLTAEGIAAAESGRFRSAHVRIEEWRDADPARAHVAALFFAVKWLGNAGTHEDSDLTTIEVLDGAKLLDEAFHRLFTGPDLDARAQTINTDKGPNRP